MSTITESQTTISTNGGCKILHFLKDMLRFIAALFEDVMLGDAFLGHGRRWESFVVLANFYYAIILTVIPDSVGNTTATKDLAHSHYATILVLFVWITFLTSFLGLFFNVRNIRYSQALRIFGAVCGFVIWGWLGVKLALIGLIASPGHVLGTLTALYEIRVVFMAAANLPRPGAPGNLGMVRTNGSGAAR